MQPGGNPPWDSRLSSALVEFKCSQPIMKTAMYEILYMPDIPDSAAINEAVELAKKYEEDETVPFVNGVLGSFLRNEVPQT